MIAIVKLEAKRIVAFIRSSVGQKDSTGWPVLISDFLELNSVAVLLVKSDIVVNVVLDVAGHLDVEGGLILAHGLLLDAVPGGVFPEVVDVILTAHEAVDGEHAVVGEWGADNGLWLLLVISEWVGHGHGDIGAWWAVVVDSVTSDGAALGLVEQHVAALEFPDPAGVGPHLAAEVVEGVVVVGVLRALVVEVNLLVAVELAAQLVGDLGAGHTSPEVVNQVLDVLDVILSIFNSGAVEDDLVGAVVVDLTPVPESVVLTISLRHALNIGFPVVNVHGVGALGGFCHDGRGVGG